MNMDTKPVIGVLLLLNLVVLLGQVWPEGAPPFARAVNIVVVAATLLYLALAFKRSA
jgi:hypothetical protein